MKPYIDEMMEIPIIKAISICESIAGVICILPRLPKVIDRLTGHQIPALAHELDDGFHSGHNGGHAGGHGLSLRSFLLSFEFWLRPWNRTRRSRCKTWRAAYAPTRSM